MSERAEGRGSNIINDLAEAICKYAKRCKVVGLLCPGAAVEPIARMMMDSAEPNIKEVLFYGDNGIKDKTTYRNC
jgi:hypothetical protein